MTARTPIADAQVYVIDWAEVGPLYERQTEDGTEVCRPDRQAVVQLTTEYGHVYNLNVELGEDFAAAEALVAAIMAKGSVNLDRWAFYRTVYGSDAFVAEGHEAAWAADERAAA